MLIKLKDNLLEICVENFRQRFPEREVSECWVKRLKELSGLVIEAKHELESHRYVIRPPDRTCDAYIECWMFDVLDTNSKEEKTYGTP